MFPEIAESMLFKRISQTHHRQPYKKGRRGPDLTKSQDLCSVKDRTAKQKNVFTAQITDKRLIGIPTHQQARRAEELNEERMKQAFTEGTPECLIPYKASSAPLWSRAQS